MAEFVGIHAEKNIEPAGEIVLFESSDAEVRLPVNLEDDTVWLSQAQMAELFGRTQPVIARHIGNVFSDGEVERESNMQYLHICSSERSVAFYSLDVIISVGYRVKSQRGVEFRRWATDVLRRYVLEGHVESERRLRQLGMVAKVIERVPGDVGAREILDIVESYTTAFDLLDQYDRATVMRPRGTDATFRLDYEECVALIGKMRGRFSSDLFGVPRDESFRSSVAVVYQSFEGEELYPTAEEKAANLLYLVIKNHSFLDGNKRIACALFLYFLERNGLLFRGLDKRISDTTLVAVALMIAESRPEEKESMVALVMNFLA